MKRWLVISVLGCLLWVQPGWTTTVQFPKIAWHGIYIQGAKVGYSYWEARKTDDGYRILDRTTIDLNMLGVPKRLITVTDVSLDTQLKLRSFDFQMQTNDQKLRYSGQMARNQLVLKGADVPKKSFHVEGTVVLTPMIPLLVEFGQLPSTFQVFDPSTYTLADAKAILLGKATTEIGGTSYPAVKVQLEYMGAKSTVYIANGVLIKEESPMQMETVLEPESKATQLQGKRVDILSMFAVKPKGLKGSPQQYRVLTLKLEGLPDPSEVPLDLDFASQKLIKREGSTAILEIRAPKIPTSITSDGTPPGEEYLQPTPSMQVDDPRIQSLAKELTQGIQDPVAKAQRLLEYVYTSLAKRPTVTLPTASEVLDLGYGDCNEHAVLYGALARAAGIPTVITVGLIYQGGAYYYHAWNASYLNGRWVFVDPVMGEFPASIGHILLKIGEIEEQTRLLPVVGNLSIEVLQAQ